MLMVVRATRRSTLITYAVRGMRTYCVFLAALCWPVLAWPQAASTIGQTGLIEMPDARVAPDGTLLWTFQTGGWVWGKPTIADDGPVFAGSWDWTFSLVAAGGPANQSAAVWRLRLSVAINGSV